MVVEKNVVRFDMSVITIIQARMGSTRLPGKVMREIAGRPMIDWVVGRAQQIPDVDQTLVATSTLNREKPLVNHLNTQSVPVIRGPEEDVLSRFLQATENREVNTVVRLTADCPFLMPEISKKVVRAFKDRECDYASNTINRTYPRGFDTEVISVRALQKADRETDSSKDREHVTRYVWKRPEQFQLCSVTGDRDKSHLRLTVDEIEDLKFVRKIYEEVKNDPMNINYDDVLKVIKEHPEWMDINNQIEQKRC